MTRLAWDNIGERIFETGVDRGVLFVQSLPQGIPWSGLTSVSAAPSGGDPIPVYLDGRKIYNRAASEEFEATIEAYTYPDEFALCDGTAMNDGLDFTQQLRQPFSFSYRTRVGNDIDGVDHGYKIHIIYNALAKPTSVNYRTLSNQTEAITFNWSLTTTPVDVPGLRPTSHLMINSTKINSGTLATIEDFLYGAEHVNSRLLSPTDLLEIMPWLYFEVVPQASGINTLIVSDTLDLTGSTTAGRYTRTPRSRLVESETPGFYRLAES